MQDPSKSPSIKFGKAFTNYLIRIWNLRITHPYEYILLWDDDVSGVYRLPKYNPAVAGAFALLNYFFLPISGTFGSNTCSQEYEPFTQARAFLAEHLSRDKTLIPKHESILSLVEFAVDNKPDPSDFVQAIADSINKGVLDDSLGRDVNTPHDLFVDDTLMADIRRHILTCMAASIEALFLVMG